ncbi:MAG: methionine gamma-lyase family protein [Clostridia bacterium]|nr:methionine gamma-lyase family protein [Clostridia bacterium]
MQEYLQRLDREVMADCAPVFARLDELSFLNSQRVLESFQKHRVSAQHLLPSDGYAYTDPGRDTLDEIYADVFGCEAALVRHSFVNGTHTLYTAMAAVVRPGDRILSITGSLYDTLEEAIGLRGTAGSGSLADFGITYSQLELIDGCRINLPAVKEALTEDVRLVFMQRSKGYAHRESLTVAQLKEAADFVHAINPDICVFVDNCYGEFCETSEPVGQGIDLCAGSLIKNCGGGLALTGGYIAGKRKYIDLCADRMTCPGIGAHCGATLGENRRMFQGFFMAPHVVAQAMKTAVYASALLEKMGFEVLPRFDAPRTDIIQAVRFGAPEKLIAFCKGIQAGSPVDSFALPEPWDMPGYSDPVIMAAGTFVQGASIELSADGPIRPPYTAFFQGGLTFESGRLGILSAAKELLK